MSQTAILVGGTGVVGRCVLQRLLDDPDYTTVIAITRRPLDQQHGKLKEVIGDFASLDAHRDDIKGDVVFCCLGTTQKIAGSREKFYEVDHDCPVKLGEIALHNGAKTYVLISAIGADAKSASYYMRVKGETERDLAALGYDAFHAVRPSLILGHRADRRFAEDIGQAILPLLSPIMVGPVEKYRPIKADQIAKAMLAIANERASGNHVHLSDELQSY